MEESQSKDLLVRATQQLESTNALMVELKEKIVEKSENAEFGKAIRKNNDWWEVRDVAKKLNIEVRSGKMIGVNLLYNFLMNTGMAMFPKDFVSNKHYYAPQQAMKDKGFMKQGVKDTKKENHNGETIYDYRLLIGTEKGVPYIMKKLLDAKDEGVIGDLCSNWRDAQGWR